ncbi:MAG: hypothetical protein JWL78_136 [Chloroflexi bacterium]|nr:hypothetical protein [Chloroflexota bacterium]MEA2619206.1 hypothetical protein [Chloroflexota bacterium]
MAREEVCTLFLGDLGQLVGDMALEARRRRDSARGGPDEEFEAGRLMGLHEVVSLMQQQADAFGLPRDVLRLEAIDPERDLL